jgi:hypothetical protein
LGDGGRGGRVDTGDDTFQDHLQTREVLVTSFPKDQSI